MVAGANGEKCILTGAMFSSVVLCTGQPTSLMKADNLGREDFSSSEEAKGNWNQLYCQVHCIYFFIHLHKT